MKSRWLAKSTSAVAMIAVMGTATICPASCSRRGAGRIRNRIHPAPQLCGAGWTVGETGVDGRKPAHPDRRHDEAMALRSPTNSSGP